MTTIYLKQKKTKPNSVKRFSSQFLKREGKREESIRGRKKKKKKQT